MNKRVEIIHSLLEELIHHIESGNSNHTDEELDIIIKELTKINKGIKRLSKAYICEHILHCSHSTFDKYIAMGIIPKGKKELGFKELSWSENDLIEAKRYRSLDKK